MSIASFKEHSLVYIQNQFDKSANSTPMMPRAVVSSSGKVDVSVFNVTYNPAAEEEETSSNDL